VVAAGSSPQRARVCPPLSCSSQRSSVTGWGNASHRLGHSAPLRTPLADATHSPPTQLTSGLRPSCPKTERQLLSLAALPQGLCLSFSRAAILAFANVSPIYLNRKPDYNLPTDFSIGQPAAERAFCKRSPICFCTEDPSLETALESFFLLPQKPLPFWAPSHPPLRPNGSRA